MPGSSRLVIQRFKDVTVVNFEDSSILDTLQVEQMGEQLYELVDRRDRKKLILDFTKVQMLSSSALGVLITLQKKSAAIKGKVVLCGVRPELLKIFKITKLEKLFAIRKNEEKALADFGVTTAG